MKIVSTEFHVKRSAGILKKFSVFAQILTKQRRPIYKNSQQY